MVDMKFNKQVDVGALHKALVDAGFDINGVSYDSGTNTCTVHLKDTELKDPTTIVTNYVYVAPVPIDWRGDFSKASTVADKLQIIAKRLELI